MREPAAKRFHLSTAPGDGKACLFHHPFAALTGGTEVTEKTLKYGVKEKLTAKRLIIGGHGENLKFLVKEQLAAIRRIVLQESLRGMLSSLTQPLRGRSGISLKSADYPCDLEESSLLSRATRMSSNLGGGCAFLRDLRDSSELRHRRDERVVK